jgi:LPXTG-site transpeptidase (sortase) family protein
MSSLVYDFFNPYPDSELLVKASDTRLLTRQNVQTKAVLENKVDYPYSEKSNSLQIPSIGIMAPLVIGESTNATILEKNLNKGVVYYPESVLPGENGQIAILGHSAPAGWPKIKYDWVFSNINDLKFGDKITLHFNNRQYIYRVIKKDIVKPGEDIQSNGLEKNNNILVLISCWPPGKNYLRIAVIAELIK